MAANKIIEELGEKIREIFAATPARDVEKNLRALLVAVFEKFDLVTREELDIQTKVLARTREKLAGLESRIVELEAELRRR